MGSNDACEKDSDAETIVSSLVALTELLISECKLQFIVLYQILPRKHSPFEEYNDRVRQINTLVSEALLHIKRAKFWRHRGLIDPSADIYLADGIHLIYYFIIVYLFKNYLSCNLIKCVKSKM